MGLRRIYIGVFVAILVFSLVNLLGDNFWSQANYLILNFESKITFNKKYSNDDFLVMQFKDESKHLLLKNRSRAERKETFFNLLGKLDNLGASSITVVLSKENKIGLYQNDLRTLANILKTPVQTLQNKDIEHEWLDNDNKKVLLDPSINETLEESIEEFQAGLINELGFQDKNIFLISPNLDLSQKDQNSIINYFENRSIKFISFSMILLFIVLLAYCVLAAMMVYPARIALFGIISFIAFTSSQVAYSFFDSYIEIASLVSSLLCSLLLTSLFDIDFEKLSQLDFFKQEIAEEFKALERKAKEAKITAKAKSKAIEEVAMSQTPTGVGEVISKPKEEISQNLLEEIHYDLKNKYYNDYETKLEELALEFEERCFDNVTTIQEKLIDLLSDSEMSQRDNLRLGLIKHNFDQLMGEIDKNLFNMVPFRFEGDQGFLNILEHLASKVYYQSKSQIQIRLESEVSHLKLKNQEKINVFRIIESLMNLIIKTSYTDKAKPEGLDIKLQITQEQNNLIFNIGYQGISLETYKTDSKMQDAYKRLAALKKAKLDFEERLGFNYIKFSVENALQDSSYSLSS